VVSLALNLLERNDDQDLVLPWMAELVAASHNICEPFIETCNIYCRVRTIHADAFLSQPQKRVVLGVGLSKGLQGTEDDWILDFSVINIDTNGNPYGMQ